MGRSAVLNQYHDFKPIITNESDRQWVEQLVNYAVQLRQNHVSSPSIDGTTWVATSR